MKTNHPAASPLAPVEVDRFRRAAACYPTGVTVITCVDQAGVVHGMTANSFVSVSLCPPTVLVSVKQHGRMHQLLLQRGRYGVSVLAAYHETLSHHFGGHPDPGLVPEYAFVEDVCLLAGAVAHFVCDVIRVVNVQDHTLFIAEVIDCAEGSESPLIFFRSTLRAQI